MARLVSVNYTASNFPYATEPNDPFLKGDVQTLAVAVEGHTHEPGKGLKVSGQAITAPLDLPGAFRAQAGPPSFPAGAGLEIYYDTTAGGRGIVHAYDRTASTYKDLIIVGQTITLQHGGARAMLINANGDINIDSRLLIGGGSSPIYGYGPDSGGTQLIGMQGLTVTPGMTYLAGVQVNGNAQVSGSVTISGNASVQSSLFVTGGQNIGQSLNVGLDIVAGRNVNFAGNTTTGTLTVNGGTVLAGNLSVNGGIIYLESSSQVMVRWNGSNARVEVPYGNGLWAPYLVAGNNVQAPDVYAARHRVSGSNTYLFAVTGECVAFINVTPGSALAQVAINEQNGHSKILWVNGAAGGTTGWQQESTRASKTDITPLAPAAALALLRDSDLQAYRYKHRDEVAQIGFLAEEWAAAVPEAVQYHDERLESMSYSTVTPILFAAVQALLARVEALEAA